MKKILLITFIIIGSVLSNNSIIAQGNAIAVEDIKKQCSDIPIEKRIKINVSRFVISASGQSSYNLDNFSTLLENALVNIECFRVLGMRKDNMSDLTETEYEEEAKEEKPQYIIAGEITNYYVDEKSETFIVNKKTETAHLTFVVKIKQGKDIIWTQKFNATGNSTNKKSNIWGTVSTAAKKNLFGNASYSSEKSTPVEKAYGDAMEAGINLAVSYIVDLRDKMVSRGDRILNKGAEQKTTTIILNKATYTHTSKIEKKLKTSSNVSDVQTSLKNGVAKFTVSSTGSHDDILDILTLHLSSIVEVTGSEPKLNKITLEAK